MQQPPPPPSMPATGYPAPPYPNGGGQHGTAYPYAAYPQQPPPQYYYNNNNNNNFNASRSFFRAFIGTMICLVLIFGVILIITWLLLRPSLPSFQLTSLSLSNFNTTSQSLSATWHLSFLVRNRNKKMSVTYNSLRSSLFYRNYFLSDSQLPPFKQDTLSQTTLNATLSVSTTYVEPRLIDDVNIDREQRGSIMFDVQVVASTSFRSGSWRFRSRLLKVLCKKVAVGVSSNATSGNLIGGPRECQVWN